MPQNFLEVVLDGLASGDYVVNWLFETTFPSGLYAFHLGPGPLTFEAVTYIGGASVLEFKQIDASVDLSASPIEIIVRAVPDENVDPDVLASIDDEQWKRAPLTIKLALMNPNYGTIERVYSWWKGKIDTIEHTIVQGESYTLSVKGEPGAIEHSRKNPRMRSDSDQKLIDPADKFFEHAARVPSERLVFGRASVVAPVVRRPGDPGFGSPD